MMSGYDFDAYVHSIARRQPRRLPACLSLTFVNSVNHFLSVLVLRFILLLLAEWMLAR